MKLGNYEFKQTCSACPEQYDVFDKEGGQVSYVRLRWGSLYAACPDVDGTIVYSADIGNDNGCFRSDKERFYHLRKIAERIEWYTFSISCPDCGQRVVLEDDELADYMLDLDDVGKAVVECPECNRLITVRDDGDGLFVYSR